MASTENTITSELKDFSVPISETAKQDFKNHVQAKYIRATPELEAFGIFDPQKCPSTQAELIEYGNAELKQLKVWNWG